MTIAAAPLGGCSTADAAGEPRPWAALARATQWINSSPLTSTDLQGKVVLVDFWTYTCINWLRTLPYVRTWADRYHEGLVVIGVHTPEFSFEHDLGNVRRAVGERRIDYPVAVDNDAGIWRAFDNQFWPAIYLLDPRGRIRHHHFGEGGYEETEEVVRRLLADQGTAAGDPHSSRVEPDDAEAAADWDDLKSRENYLGYERGANFAPGRIDLNRRRVYAGPARLAADQWALTGEWTVGGEAIVSSAPHARIVKRFHARDLHLVMGPARQGSPIRFRVTIDGRSPGPARGRDVDEVGNGTLSEHRLYQLIRQPQPIVDRLFEIEFLDVAAEAYSFTFG